MMAQERLSVCLTVVIFILFLICDVTEVEVVLRSVCDFSKNNIFTQERHNYKQNYDKTCQELISL